MDAFCATAPARWGISPETATRRRRPAAGSRPAARSTPRSGPTFVVVGDAAGSVNPFNGEGISVAYETGPPRRRRGRPGARDRRRPRAAHRTTQRLDEVYGLYFKVARAFVRAIGNPAVMRELTRVGMHSRTLMEWVLRIMANLLRPDEVGPAEAAYTSRSPRLVAASRPSR